MDLATIIATIVGIIGAVAAMVQVVQYFQERKEKKETILSKEVTKTAARTIHDNLPPRGKFVGRQNEKARLHELLRSDSKLIGLDGFRGIGKTSLALEVAHDCLDARRENLSSDRIARFDGIIWISAQNRELGLKIFLDTILRTLEKLDIILKELDDKTEAVRKVLQDKPYLLVVDNFEAITDEGIADFLLNHLPDPSKALITTNEKKLNQIRFVSLGGLPESEALTLIRQEAQRIGLQKLADAENEILLRVCQATGGAPLAIKWVAGQIKQKGQSLDTVLRAIHAARGDIFKYIFDSSWQLLSRDARQVLKVIALFATSVSRPAVETSSNIRDFAFDDAIGQLVEMSLVEATDELDSVKQCFSIHPLTRRFVIGKRSDKDREIEKAILERAANYYLDLVISYFPLAKERKELTRLTKYRAFVEQRNNLNQRPNYSQLAIDLENILTIVDWCHMNQKNEMLIDFSLSLTGFFENQGYSEESIKHGENAIEAARAQHDMEAVALLCRFPVGWFYYIRGKYGPAKQKSEESITIFEELSEALYLAASKRLLGLTLLGQKEINSAALALKEAKDIAEKYSLENEQVAYSLIHLGDAALADGKREKANELFSEGYEMFRRLNYEPGMVSALDQLANTERVLEKRDLAKKHFNELQQLAQLLGRERSLGHYHLGNGLMLDAQGEFEEARREIETALDIYKRIEAEPRIREAEIELQRINNNISNEKTGDRLIRNLAVKFRKLATKGKTQ